MAGRCTTLRSWRSGDASFSGDLAVRNPVLDGGRRRAAGGVRRRHHRFARSRAESTTKAHAGGVAPYLRWCARTRRDWRTAAQELGLFIVWLRHTPAGPPRPGRAVPGPGGTPARRERRINGDDGKTLGRAAGVTLGHPIGLPFGCWSTPRCVAVGVRVGVRQPARRQPRSGLVARRSVRVVSDRFRQANPEAGPDAHRLARASFPASAQAQHTVS